MLWTGTHLLITQEHNLLLRKFEKANVKDFERDCSLFWVT